METFKNKTVFITGASRGIGQGILLGINEGKEKRNEHVATHTILKILVKSDQDLGR